MAAPAGKAADGGEAKAPRGLFANFVLAGSSTALACILSNPMEVVKTRMQMQGELQTRSAAKAPYRNAFHCFYTICKDEGLSGIQRGLQAGMLYQIAMNGTRLGLFGPLSNFLGAKRTDISAQGLFLRNLAAGACTGAIGGLVGSPFFLVKARLQNSGNPGARFTYNYTGLLDGFRQVIAQEGAKGLFRGAEGAITRVMVGSATQLSSYESCKRFVQQCGVPEGVPLHLMSSLCAGFIVTTAMNPFDVISTRLYSQQVGAEAMYRPGFGGIVDVVVKTAKTEGAMGFYKGWFAHYLRLGPHTVFTFLIWEQAKRFADSLGY